MGESDHAAYRGSVWIESETGNIVRLEQEAEDLPPGFPADHVQTSVDCEYVPVGDERALLPVRSEILICYRSQSVCGRNDIRFADDHKYGSVSTIRFDKGK